MVHLCSDLTAVSNSGRLRRSDVSEDNRDGCVDMRQLQCQTRGKPKRRRSVCVRKHVHLVHLHWFILWIPPVWIDSQLDTSKTQNYLLNDRLQVLLKL